MPRLAGVLPDKARMRLEFCRAIALRDPHKMSAAQKSLTLVDQLAGKLGDAIMHSIVAGLREPEHSMDEEKTHREPVPTGTPWNLWLAGGLAVAAGGVWLVARRLPRR